ncbi:low affinity immunoglobulin gamma Fc region receptor II-like [Aquarana catesbeiana]|uniref:low affinity immunoglobulin gamma Fc region receptor II-like n=1 Tax=Aquarana catesbeiana TaxID=8400 RepID=UPI003CC9B516
MPRLTPIIFILLAVRNTEGAVTPVVTMSPNWNNVYSGDWVTLSCSVGSVEVDKPGYYYYTWYKDGKVYMYEKSIAFTAKKEHSGVYTCSVGSGIYSNPLRLHVISGGTDFRPVVTLSPNWNKVYIGDQVTLSCSLGLSEENNDDHYPYTWYKNNGFLKYGEKIQFTAKEEDSGVYGCSVKYGIYSVPLQLDVITQGTLS